jgi:2-polyprenyl-3-methyl-5-hydroxy-6-metoxy-1,4-benzoquinol methylase
LTSLCEIYEGRTEVYFCDRCGHLQTTEIADIATYYDHQYRIDLESEEEDQLYRFVDGKKVFRVDHQVETIVRKLGLRDGAKVLDYGCAKSATSKKLLARRPDLQVHLFDVSEMYVPFWRAFASPESWATYAPRPEWAARFDAVFSLFALEHAADPRHFVAQIAGLLRPEGCLYLIVPNVYENVADFVVVDHVNHFSPSSLSFLLAAQGFERIEIDADAHDSAFVVTAVKGHAVGSVTELDSEVATRRQRANEMSVFWADVASRIQSFESLQTGKRAAIYGSAFYGTFIASCLKRLGDVEVFLDQSPFRQGKRLLDKPIIPPDNIDLGIDVVYVGLNPKIARRTIEDLKVLNARSREYFYL